MKRIESMSISEFMNRDFEAEKAQRKLRNKRAVKEVVIVATYTGVVLFTGFDIANASGGIDDHARKLYSKLLSVGKWVIIIKGGFDTINDMVKGDNNSAKRNFLSYLLIYLILNGLPWAMDEVDSVFNEMTH